VLHTHALESIRENPTPSPERMPRHAEVLDGVASELMPPMWELGMHLSPLRLPSDLSARERRFVADVDRQLGRIARVLAGVHDFVLVEREGELPFATRPTDMGAICEEAIVQLRDVGVEDPITLVGYGNGEGEWDPHRLAQAVSYLVEGALAAAPAEPKVRVRWRGTEEYVLLAIERDATPEDAGGPRLDDHFGAAVGGGSERGVRTYVARKILGQHRASLVRFATHETVTYVAVIPRAHPALA
jgi:signal transduction histidine kinase